MRSRNGSSTGTAPDRPAGFRGMSRNVTASLTWLRGSCADVQSKRLMNPEDEAQRKLAEARVNLIAAGGKLIGGLASLGCAVIVLIIVIMVMMQSKPGGRHG